MRFESKQYISNFGLARKQVTSISDWKQNHDGDLPSNLKVLGNEALTSSHYMFRFLLDCFLTSYNELIQTTLIQMLAFKIAQHCFFSSIAIKNFQKITCLVFHHLNSVSVIFFFNITNPH